MPPKVSHFGQSAEDTSTCARKANCPARVGPKPRLQWLPQALLRPSRVQDYYTWFASERLSPSAHERVPAGGPGNESPAPSPPHWRGNGKFGARNLLYDGCACLTRDSAVRAS